MDAKKAYHLWNEQSKLGNDQNGHYVKEQNLELTETGILVSDLNLPNQSHKDLGRIFWSYVMGLSNWMYMLWKSVLNRIEQNGTEISVAFDLKLTP